MTLQSALFVVEDGLEGTVQTQPVWKGHWVALCVLLGGSVRGGLVTERRGPFPELVEVRNATLNSGLVQDAGVYLQHSSTTAGSATGLQVQVVYADRPSDYEKAGSQIAAIVLRTDPRAIRLDYISIVANEGFHVGLATYRTNSGVVSHTPSEWLAMVPKPESKQIPPRSKRCPFNRRYTGSVGDFAATTSFGSGL